MKNETAIVLTGLGALAVGLLVGQLGSSAQAQAPAQPGQLPTVPRPANLPPPQALVAASPFLTASVPISPSSPSAAAAPPPSPPSSPTSAPPIPTGYQVADPSSPEVRGAIAALLDGRVLPNPNILQAYAALVAATDPTASQKLLARAAVVSAPPPAPAPAAPILTGNLPIGPAPHVISGSGYPSISRSVYPSARRTDGRRHA